MLKKITFQSFILFVPLLLLANTVQIANPDNISTTNDLAIFYTVEGNTEEPFNNIAENELKKIGFKVTDPHKRVNEQYKEKYGSTTLDVLSFMSIINDKDILPLLNIDPRIAGFSPFNLLIYKKLDEKVTHIGHLKPKVMLDILEIEDKTLRDKFISSFSPLYKKLEAEFEAKGLKFTKSSSTYKALAKKRMINFEYKFETPEDMEDFLDEFQEDLEKAFTDKEYLIAGYHNFLEGTDDAKEILKDYDAFWTYSLCHLEFSYNMFDNEDAHPEAGLFAPCSMYMYIKKGTNTVVVGMPTLANWSNTLGITDDKRVELVSKLDKEIPEILTAFGMKAMPNVNPLIVAKTQIKDSPIKEDVTKEIIQSDTPDGTLALLYTLEGDNIEKIFTKLIEKDIKDIDFKVTDPHLRVNDQYKEKYGSTVLDVLSFLSIVNDKMVLPLLNIDPRIASTAPFNMLIHKRLDENVTHVGHLVPKVFLDMIGIEDKEIRETFTKSFVPLNKKLEKTFKENNIKYTKSFLPYKKLPEKTMMNFEYEFEVPEDMEDFIDEFQEKFEDAFTKKEYLIAGYHNFMEGTDNAKEVLKDYDAFWTYSLCHLEFSYNMFDNEGARPNSGLFAPCSMYMYIKKGSNKVVIGMLRLHNWSDTLDITDAKRLKLVEKLDIEIPQILTSIGMKTMPNLNPLTFIRKKAPSKKPIKTSTTQEKEENKSEKTISKPNKTIAKQKDSNDSEDRKSEEKENTQIDIETINITIPKPVKPIKPIKAIKINTINGSMNDGNTRSIKFSKRVPPNYTSPNLRIKKEVPKNTSTQIGQVINGKISTYLRGKFMDVKTAQAKLAEAGFEIIASTPVNKKGNLVSIVFSDKELLKISSKNNRGFMASLRLLVNKKDDHISITNPLYLAKAFLQDDFDDKVAKATLKKITSTFTDLVNSKDRLKFQLLPSYKFMVGMPKYEDMEVIASGKNLLEKIKNNENVLFEQKLENGSTLIGVKLSRRTSKFTGKIGTNNAALLPYPLLIENNEAKIMDPKYYISVMYPLLQMSEFMMIATIPGAIIKDCEKVFN